MCCLSSCKHPFRLNIWFILFVKYLTSILWWLWPTETLFSCDQKSKWWMVRHGTSNRLNFHTGYILLKDWGGKRAWYPFLHQHRTGSGPVAHLILNRSEQFDPKLNWFGTLVCLDLKSSENECAVVWIKTNRPICNNRIQACRFAGNQCAQQLATTVYSRCALCNSLREDASLIQMVLLKTGGKSS